VGELSRSLAELTACMAYTMVNVPYGSLTPELRSDFDESTMLNAFRMSFAVVGTFIGALAVRQIIGMFPTENAGWTGMAGIMGAVMLLAEMITVFTVKEPDRAADEARERQGFIKTYAAAFRNKPFVLALATYAMRICCTSIVQGSLIYYFKYLYGGSASFELALVCLLVPVIPSSCLRDICLRPRGRPHLLPWGHGDPGGRIRHQPCHALRAHPRYGGAGPCPGRRAP